MLGYCQRKVIIDSLLDFASYAFYYINIEVTYELLTLEIIADNPSVDFGMPGELFEVKQATLSEHINNIISSGELDETSIGFSDKSSGGRKPKIYNLDMILSVGYRVNSKRGIAFRRWANSVLKKYVIQGYAINEKRLQALERTVDIQTKMLASTLEVEESLFLEFLARNNALYRDDNKIISDVALVAITLMIAESRPEEKDIMVNLVMNFLTM